MVDNLGYTIHTHDIPIGVFLDMIKGDIKKLIQTYGHKNCGLMHEELCEKIQTIITTKKTIISRPMDDHGRGKLNSEWRSKKNGFLNKLFEEEGFINMCFPKKNYPNNKILYQLLSKHIQFCKEKDVKREAVEKKPEYSECVKYNSWIETEKASFTHEYLRNVKHFRAPTVNKYFSTKEHPRGHDPRDTYNNSKVNCKLYNLPSKKNEQKPVEKSPINKPQIPSVPNIRQGSQGKDGKSAQDGDTASAKTKTDAKNLSQTEPSPDSPTSPLINTEVDSTANGQDISLQPKDHASSVSRNEEKKDATPIRGEPPTNDPSTTQDEAPPQTGSPPPPLNDAIITPATQSVSPPKPTISLSSSDSTVQDITSSKTAVTSANIHSAKTLPEPSAAVPSLAQPQPSAADTPPAITASQESGTPASSSVSTFTTPVTTTTMSPAADTSLTMSTIQVPIQSTEQVPSVSGSKEPPPPSASEEPKTTAPNTEPQQTVSQAPTGLSGSDNGGLLDPKQPDSADDNKIITLSENTPQQSKDSSLVSSTSLPEGAQPDGKPSITSTKFPPLNTIIPTIIIILAAITLLFQLYKYTPFGFLLGRRKKRKKQDLRRIIEIPEKPTYESPNITVHELEDSNLLGQIVENDAYTKLLKINRYKQEMQKRKKENKKTLIEVHMEVLEEYKSDEWELHKGDFLEICLRGFINDENDFYSNFPYSKLTINNIKKEKTIEDIQKHEILWNNWIEDHRHILEQWKKEDWFQNLKTEWKNEEKLYKEKNDKLQENMLNEQKTYSIVSQKDIWKQWISKQATLIKMFNQEDWFKELVDEQNKEKNNYHINEYNNISVTSKIGLKNEKSNHEYSRSKDIIQKLMVQIHMMVLEECIKEDIIKQKELCIDNFIEDIHNQNNYDEKRNIQQCDTDDFNVHEYEEIHISKNK